MRLKSDFFQTDPVSAARNLIGKRIVCQKCSGIIVETEAYADKGDEAAHTFTRPSAREFVTKYGAGSAYVYLNYGMYWLANVLTKGPKGNGFVLLRALEPENGIDLMRKRRNQKKMKDLCSGPGKLTIAMSINGKDHGQSFTSTGSRFWFEETHCETKIVTDTRIGITRSADLLWRFLKKNNDFVSKKKGGQT
ncbi:MAG: DNA-3-methyladenine glycosylase [Verrucomicrobiales bacterium]|nr:DNA-3-methyladenine glycosylase [Verrucomicrobiales bacterium]